MYIDVFSIQHNESKILPYFLRHYASFADRIFIYDDSSTDGSRNIIAQCEKAMILEVRETGLNEDYFRVQYTEGYKIHSRGIADFVMCVDGDEFIYHPDIRRVLRKMKANRVQVAYCEGWNMFSDTFPTTDGQIYDEVKMGVPDKWQGKAIVFNPNVDMKWALGRHSLHSMPGVKIAYKTDIKMLHFHHLGTDYNQKRMDQAWTRFSTEKLRQRHGRYITGEIYLHSMQWYEDQQRLAIRCPFL